MIKDLRGMAGSLAAGAHAQLVAYFVMPPGMTAKEAEATLGRLLDLLPERGVRG
jgi:hypothetical protein